MLQKTSFKYVSKYSRVLQNNSIFHPKFNKGRISPVLTCIKVLSFTKQHQRWKPKQISSQFCDIDIVCLEKTNLLKMSMCSKKYYSMKQFKASSKQSHALRSSTWAHFWSLFLSNETCLGVLTEQIYPASTPISKHYQLVFHLLTPSGCCLNGSPIECICWIF